MALFNFINIRISGISCAVPKNIVRPQDFRDRFSEEDISKFIQMTGITETRRTSANQTASDLCFTAASDILRRKGIDRNEIGALVFGTHSPDYRRPASAFILHKRLGLNTETVAFDISLGCSSLVYGIQVVASMLNSSDISKAILVVGDTAGKTTNPDDRASAMLVGEAGVAVLIEKCEEPSPLTALVRSDGNGYRYLIVPAGGYRNLNVSREDLICSDGNKRSLYDSFMIGTSVFTFTISDVPRVIRDFLEITKTSVEDYDCFAFHQANLYILKQIAKKVRIPLDKMPLTLDRYGNTSGASPALTLCDRYGSSNNEIINLLICSFGVGLSWGVTTLQVNTSDIFPLIEDDSIFEEGIINSPDDLYKSQITA
jgi:3-oxoacyl-[acyl-carrier-protein] synthase III